MTWNLIGSGRRSATQIQRAILMLCALILLFVALLDHISAFARYEQRRSYQESPLSPVATPITASLPASLTTTLTATETIVLTLTETAPTTVTTAFTSPLTSPATTTLTTIMTAPVEVTATLPIATTPVPTADLINRGQTSLLLVGVVLGGILVVIAVVLGRQR